MENKSTLLTVVAISTFLFGCVNGQTSEPAGSVPTQGSQVSFQKITIDSTNSNVTGIYADDINGDGLKDIVVCERVNNRIILWLNNGGNPLRWIKQVVDSDYYRPLYITIKDINNDGQKDIIASSSEGNNIAWWKNEGGAWTKQIIDSDLPNAHAVDAADFNGDGNMDILATSAGSNKVVWWQSDGANPIHWQKRVVDSLFTTTQTCKAVDIDNDNKVDIVAASSVNNEIAWWKNKGGNPVTWEKHIIANGSADGVNFPHWIEIVDIDKDGYLDVIGSMYGTGEMAWWKNENGNYAHWTKNKIVGNFPGVLTVKAADIDNDSFIDVVGASAYLRDIAWWKNNGNSTSLWTELSIDKEFKGAWPLFVCDLDNDGDMDIISGGDVPFGNPPLSWWKNMLIESANK